MSNKLLGGVWLTSPNDSEESTKQLEMSKVVFCFFYLLFNMKVSHEEGLKTENAILSKHSSFLNGNLQINVFLSVLYSIKCCV